MPIHIGKLIKKKADELKISQEELGKKINRSKQNVGDIYKRNSIDTELLLNISKALEFDLIDVYYSEEPLKSFRKEALAPYKKEIAELKQLLAQKEDRIKYLEKTVESNEKVIHLLEEERQKYKKK